jgi:hypothetical protein
VNKETTDKPGSPWALPVALLVLGAYFVLGILSGGAERGWWS